ncbi:hypothetical protein Tco_0922349 [Tanacetum coccineum]|uniref:Uncharacterized protein n=1 Tax=Tanacetum coccineum TaxID=301880 RepID=A0ABQ5CZ42_9ASTR
MDIACFMGYLLQTTVKDCERVEEINAFIKGAICDAQGLGRCIHAYQLLLQSQKMDSKDGIFSIAARGGNGDSQVEPIKQEEEKAPEEECGIGDMAAATFVCKCSALRGVWLSLLQHSSER